MNKIRLEDFKSGRKEKGIDYSFFVPSPINHSWTWSDPKLNSLLEGASMKLGEINSYAHLVPNIDLFIHLYVTKEAVISSRIEGTQTNIDEALLPQEEIQPEKRKDWQEVNNYTKALNYAIEQLEQLPVSSRLLRTTHKILMENVRGEHKSPGNFRKSQNWIGGASLDDAVFIPPAHHYIGQLMSDLEQFLHNEEIDVPALIKIGMAHYQFETIHPFLDGNGRIGRLLITLYLVSKGLMAKPLLYLSVFFEKNKALYYDNLMKVRNDNDMIQWLKYFLVGLKESAAESSATLSQILALKKRCEETVTSTFGRRTQSGLLLLNQLFREPFVRVSNVQEVCGLSKKASYDLLKEFVDAGLLNETSRQVRGKVFVFEVYLSLFK
jgi:Fic family protein